MNQEHARILEVLENTESKELKESISRERVEVMLNAYSWDSDSLMNDFKTNPAAVFNKSRLSVTRNAVNDNSCDQGPCTICGDAMEAELIPDEIIHVDVKQVNQMFGKRSLSCPAGHRYCVDCWRAHLNVQVKDNSAYALKCPGLCTNNFCSLSTFL